jgi:hypothetical protein
MPRAGLRPVPLHQFHSPETGLDLVDLGFGGIWDLVGFGDDLKFVNNFIERVDI